MADTTSALTVQNGFSTTLSTSVNTTDTIFYLASLPTGAQGFLTIDEGLSSEEIIFYTSKGANFVQLTSIAQGRAQDGTSASGHTSGAVVKQKTNAGYWKALQDGTGLNLSSLTLPNNTVTAPMLATNAITLGYAQAVATQTSIGTSATDLTSLSVTVTVPAGGRRVRITGFANLSPQATNTYTTFTIMEGATQLASGIVEQAATNLPGIATTIFSVSTPTAGSHTYKLQASTNTGTTTSAASATSPSFILVEAI